MNKYFTPSPWGRKIFDKSSSGIWSPASGKAVAWVDGRNAEEIESNANLIAAAPDLLEALEDIAQYWRIEGNESHYCSVIAEKAIAKATGERA